MNKNLSIAIAVMVVVIVVGSLAFLRNDNYGEEKAILVVAGILSYNDLVEYR